MCSSLVSRILITPFCLLLGEMREKRSFNKRNNYNLSHTLKAFTTTMREWSASERWEKNAVGKCTFTAKCDDKLCICNGNAPEFEIQCVQCADGSYSMNFEVFELAWCEIAWKIVPSARSFTSCMCMWVGFLLALLFLHFSKCIFIHFSSLFFSTKSVTHKQIRISNYAILFFISKW